jgi:hypothetical protein
VSNTLKSQNARMEMSGLTAVNVLVEGMQQGRGIIRLLAAFGLLLLPRIGRQPPQPTWHDDRTPF